MAARYTEDGDTPEGNCTGSPSDDNSEVGDLLAALDGQIARTQALIGRATRLVEEMDHHRKARPKFRVPPH